MFKKKIETTTTCPNCGHDISGKNFCDECGQFNNIRKPTLFELILESIENLFSFDSKFYFTIQRLIVKPGYLTEEYTAGKKVSYTPPIRIFILTAILLFTSNRILKSFSNDEPWLQVNKANTEMLLIPSDSTEKNDTVSASSSSILHGNLASLELNRGTGKIPLFSNHILSHPKQNVVDALKELNMETSLSNRLLYYHLAKFNQTTLKEFTDYFRSHMLIFLLCFIPFIATTLKIFYLRNSIYFVDHFIFALHTTSAFFVFLFASNLVKALIGDVVYLISIPAFGFYLFKALKRNYKQSTTKTVVKYIGLNASMFVLSIFFLLLSSFATFFFM